jgi:hypothetical protein
MDDLVLKSIRDGTQYEELPDRVQQALSFKEWQERCVYRANSSTMSYKLKF